MARIVLASMPFSPIEWPSIAMGVLVASGRRAGLDVGATYPCFGFARECGVMMYELLASYIRPDSLIADWVFSKAAFPNDDYPVFPDSSFYTTTNRLVTDLLCPYFDKPPEFFREQFDRARDLAAPFVEKTAREILAERPAIVGCTSTFMQYNASIALLRRIKELDPAVVTLLGGSNCEAEMGLVMKRLAPWVDFVVSGEADTLFPVLCAAILEHGADLPAALVPYGVYDRRKASTSRPLRDAAETALVGDMAEVPTPDYADYFRELEATGLADVIVPVALIETSRGCWKGQRQHCTFCGLNGSRTHFRSRSPERAALEFDRLSEQYGVDRFMATDTIMDPRYTTTLLQDLRSREKQYSIYFESISNLSEQQVEALGAAGVCWIQSGAESIHDDLLRLLNKGTSALRNIEMLKYAREHAIKISWNILHGIPGDADRHYVEMTRMLPLLHHLDPPQYMPIRFDRFSAYHQEPARFGLRLRPLDLYAHIYPYDAEALADFAYFFQAENHPLRPDDERQAEWEMDTELGRWRGAVRAPGGRPRLEYWREGTGLRITDSRACATDRTYVLDSTDAAIYDGCRRTSSKDQILAAAADAGQTVAPDLFDLRMTRLIEQGLVLTDGHRYLALATRPLTADPFEGFFLNRYSPLLPNDPRRRRRPARQPVWDWVNALPT